MQELTVTVTDENFPTACELSKRGHAAAQALERLLRFNSPLRPLESDRRVGELLAEALGEEDVTRLVDAADLVGRLLAALDSSIDAHEDARADALEGAAYGLRVLPAR